MTAAAEKTETLLGSTIGGGAAKSGPGCVMAVYEVTIATTLDWVILDDFTQVHFAKATTQADGVDAEAIIDGSTLNKVIITGTGATTLFVIGTPA